MKKNIKISVLFCFAVVFQLSAQKSMFKTGMLLDNKKPAGVEVYEFESLGFGEKLPDSVSLVQYAPYPGNQGNYASCVGWAYGYCATSILYAQKYNLKNRASITALAMCPFSVYNRVKDPYDSRCEQGTYLHLAAKELRKEGTKRYYINEVGCNGSSPQDSIYRIFKVDNTYAIWDNYQGTDVKDSIKILYTKKALAIKTPVIIGFAATYSFCEDVRKSDGFWDKNTYNMYPIGGHAMCVVGYNDKKFGGAFLIQNSWGPEWGKDGYAWVSYKDYAKYTLTAYVIELRNDAKASVTKPRKGCEYGDCINSYSRFRFENGDTYEGDVKGGKPQGNGIYQYKNGDVYTGPFKDGKKEGKGTYYFADGTVKVAYWLGDTINAGADYLEYGYGNIEIESSKFNGYYKGEKWLFGTYISGAYSVAEYTGKFADGKKNDFGVKSYPNYLYVGTVKEDSYRDFYAYISTRSKRIYVYSSTDAGFKRLTNEPALAAKINSFSENKADSVASTDKKLCTYGDCENGYGKYTYPSGNTYEGFFNNGYRNGYGKYTVKVGALTNTYEGTYLASQRNGVGKIIMSDGSTFIGQFKAGKKEGYGIYTSSDKRVVAGLWEKNVFQEWEEELGFGGADDPKAKETEFKTDKKNKHTAATQTQFELK